MPVPTGARFIGNLPFDMGIVRHLLCAQAFAVQKKFHALGIAEREHANVLALFAGQFHEPGTRCTIGLSDQHDSK